MEETKLFIWEYWDERKVHKAIFSMAKTVEEARRNLQGKIAEGFEISNVVKGEPTSTINKGEWFGWEIGPQFT
jgi:hypothetical protein